MSLTLTPDEASSSKTELASPSSEIDSTTAVYHFILSESPTRPARPDDATLIANRRASTRLASALLDLQSRYDDAQDDNASLSHQLYSALAALEEERQRSAALEVSNMALAVTEMALDARLQHAQAELGSERKRSARLAARAAALEARLSSCSVENAALRAELRATRAARPAQPWLPADSTPSSPRAAEAVPKGVCDTAKPLRPSKKQTSALKKSQNELLLLGKERELECALQAITALQDKLHDSQAITAYYFAQLHAGEETIDSAHSDSDGFQSPT
ncbi:hypothetical protein WOLCODRAFT_138008 [Wolfiporia cocos MD-104 SS10]|uniref:Uncharacterized protein n=1 Tax=Wolfiporia cocos (strain MD-104) TaxID=742152 RepID=A0A2H3K2N9_WOLCO|nr:hypothetical protein WOLCODRAFT_138008 [Wolfiporia cocos MD-104 SS10]